MIMKFSVSGSRTENGIVIKEGKSAEYGVGTWLGYQPTRVQLVVVQTILPLPFMEQFNKKREKVKGKFSPYVANHVYL